MQTSRNPLVQGALALALAATSGPASADLTLPRPSPRASVMQTVGLTDITITYSRPGVKGRAIWGDLVPYDKVWRTGANEATVIQFSDDVEVQGLKLAAGKYSLHTIPTAGDWTVIFNKDADQWGSYSYKQEADALRVGVKTRPAPHEEWMSFSFPELSVDATVLVLRWEKLEVPISIKTRTIESSFAAIDKAIASSKSDAWRLPYRAADFCNNANVRLDDAMKWVDQSIAVEANYQNTGLKARLLAKKGDLPGAIATAEKALAIAKTATGPMDTAPLEHEVAAWKKGKK